MKNILEISDDHHKTHREIKIFSQPQDLFEFAAKDFCERAVNNIKQNGTFSVVLSGGHTPEFFFDTLVKNEYYQKNIPWEKIQFFFGDERYVPSTDEKSNYHTAYEHLFSKVSVNPNHIYKIPTEFKDPKEAAQAYERTLRNVFDLKDNDYPQFDLLYLGLGDNCHTASLMPFSDVLKTEIQNQSSYSHQSNQLVTSLFDPNSKMMRITLTPKALNHAKEIIFLVMGTNKADAIWQAFKGEDNPIQYPAQIIHGLYNKTNWYLDQTAAAKYKGDNE